MSPLARKSGLAILLPALLLVGAAHAFKIDTHLWLADQLYDLELSRGRVQLGSRLGSYPIPSQIRDSLKMPGGREAFLIGVLGADLFPDMIAGQMTTHPGLSPKLTADDMSPAVKQLAAQLGTRINTRQQGWQTDDWLNHVRSEALRKSGGRPTREIAFAYGYLLHAAMDTWAHTYVNLYTGDLFSISVNQETAARHVAIENFIKNAHQSYYEPKPNQRVSRAGKTGAMQALQPVLSNGQQDNLSALTAPTRFVRETLILNKSAADQYAYTLGGEQVWSMYALWDYANRSRQQWTRIREDLDRAINQASQAVLNADAIWKAAEVAKTQAANAATHALNAKRSAENFASQQAQALNNAINEALSFLNNLPNVSATRETIENFISQLPPLLRQAYDNAKSGFANADRARNNAVKTYQDRAAASDRAARNAVNTFNDLDLKKQAEASIKQARNTAWAVVDNSFRSWRSNIEAGVDAWIRAWEETAREIMRPAGDRFTRGHNVTWPLKEWAVCWGPVFGVSASLVNPQDLAHGCAVTFSGFTNAQENFRLLVVNQAFDLLGLSHLKQKIVKMDEGLEELLRDALPQAGRMIAATIGDQAASVQGTASFAAQMWEKHIDASDLKIEFQDDGSRQNLPEYIDVATMLRNDGLPLEKPPSQVNNDLNAMLNFRPLYNAVMLSRLTFLDGKQLNAVARRAGVTRTAYTDGNPVYSDQALAGTVLIGAIRSIDGNHQWQPVAPVLPRRTDDSISNPKRATEDEPERATEETCRRFGYPFGKSYGNNCEGEEGFNTRAKGGFRFWVDPNARQQVFNNIFRGPLSPSICEKHRAEIQGLNAGIGCSTANPFPESRETKIAMKEYPAKSVVVSIGARPTSRIPTQKTPITSRPTTSTIQKPTTTVTRMQATTTTSVQSSAATGVNRVKPTTGGTVARVTRVNPASIAVSPGGQVVVALEGQNLNTLSALRIRQSGRDVPGFRTTLEPANAKTQTRRRVTVQAPSNVTLGSYQLTLFVGQQFVDVPRGTVVSVAMPKPLPVKIVR
ncbi:hypothetical protein ACFL3A_03780 [Pseudomonadota bacterium]